MWYQPLRFPISWTFESFATVATVSPLMSGV
jgi:hypothetical protein